ncbi:tRNA lysidine(34) synthetase TilS [Helicobacter sp.]|uniref:tRNA lysidine(34) synthetase TilS n=1 Tax=Helicobacter sp. TaxID=218 RepID=UPI00199B348C|nr:tRNA lysidine(34) synthetase TilS [Helicobacter sp.]MBD5164230.1 tRNA lysidine(34) synthetase TilS [Helicobacter sp.]
MSDLIPLEFLEELKRGRNLLAFSGGADSSALYFLLQDYGIPFDIAIMDYGTRKQSRLEVSYAQNLCFLDKKQCFVEYAPPILGNFESNARKLRYEFFESLVARFGYTHLILAHQLNDALEWFLMQFCKGTSVQMMQISPRVPRATYCILRPLWQTSRAQILHYLQKNQIFYFEDFSNWNPHFRRNYFRANFTDKLLSEFQSGIAFSLRLLNEESRQDNENLNNKIFEIPTLGLFCVLELESLQDALGVADFVCKVCGVLLSRAQKLELKELLREENFSLVFKHRISIEKARGKLFFAPYLHCKPTIPRRIRERYRLLGIPKKFRIFLFCARILGAEQRVLDKIANLKERK